MFDTDILIFIQRQNPAAEEWVERAQKRFVSVQTYMELIQGALSRKHVEYAKEFLRGLDFKILPLTENIGHRASIYIEEYAVSANLRTGDAIIAATAMENNLPLITANVKHFKSIPDLKLVGFKP